MAEGKKSFIAYTDWKDTFDALPDDKAGKLIKFIYAYVNDENPQTDDVLIKAVFANIKNTLKRDLQKWEHQQEQRISAAKKSVDVRKRNKEIANDRLTTVKQASTVSVNDNVSVNDTVNVNEYKRILLSEVNSDDYPNLDLEHIEIAKSFQELFIKNQTEGGVKTPSAKKAKGIWIDDIRMMIEIDKVTKDDFRKIFSFLKTDDFWKKNILSTSKLRKQFEKLLMNYNNGAKQQISTKDKLSRKMENIINSTEEH